MTASSTSLTSEFGSETKMASYGNAGSLATAGIYG
jgi:hypothetical protein